MGNEHTTAVAARTHIDRREADEDMKCKRKRSGSGEGDSDPGGDAGVKLTATYRKGDDDRKDDDRRKVEETHRKVPDAIDIEVARIAFIESLRHSHGEEDDFSYGF